MLAELDARSSGRIQVYIDEPHTGTLIATLRVPGTAVGAGWQTVEADTAPVVGTHAVFLVFKPDHGQIGDLLFSEDQSQEPAELRIPGRHATPPGTASMSWQVGAGSPIP